MLDIQYGAGRDVEALPHTAGPPKVPRRRDRLLPAMVERQRRSGVAHSARNILAKHHHAVADIAPVAAYDLAVIAAKRRADIDDRNIARIRATQ